MGLAPVRVRAAARGLKENVAPCSNPLSLCHCLLRAPLSDPVHSYSEVTSLSNVNFTARTATLDPPPHMALVKMQLEGSRDFIDEPGEWALGEDNMVYLFPTRASPDPNAAVITAVRFVYRYILRESCSQFDSLPLTSLTRSPGSASPVSRAWARSAQSCTLAMTTTGMSSW